jgi:hypothetical protein
MKQKFLFIFEQREQNGARLFSKRSVDARLKFFHMTELHFRPQFLAHRILPKDNYAMSLDSNFEYRPMRYIFFAIAWNLPSFDYFLNKPCDFQFHPLF